MSRTRLIRFDIPATSEEWRKGNARVINNIKDSHKIQPQYWYSNVFNNNHFECVLVGGYVSKWYPWQDSDCY